MNIADHIEKAESFLHSGNYEEAVEKSFKILEKCLQYTYNKIFTELGIDTQIGILTQIKNDFGGKQFNQLMIGEKLRLFVDHKLLSNHASLTKDINPGQLLKLNDIRVDSAHQKRIITKGDAYLAFAGILSFIEKIDGLLPTNALHDEDEILEVDVNAASECIENLEGRCYLFIY